MVDPTNSILHLKEIALVLLVGYCAVFYRPTFRYLPFILLCYAAVALGFIAGQVQQVPVDYTDVGAAVKSFLICILLLWVPHFNVLRLAKGAGVTLALVLVILYAFVVSDPLIEWAVFTYSQDHDSTMMMSTRYFLGFKVYGMYYKSLISLSLVLFSLFFALFNKPRRRFGVLLSSVLVVCAFLMSGSRNTMLLPFFLFGLNIFLVVRHKRFAKYFLYPLIALGVLAFLTLVFLLATEGGESSNDVKFGHLVSYGVLFSNHPEYLLFGQGLGASFYSEGFRGMTMLTEWTYIEMLRKYGLVGAACIMTFVLYPFRVLLPRIQRDEVLGFSIAYLAYLLISGTNPLLLGSTGMLVLLMVYSYIHRLEEEMPLGQGGNGHKLCEEGKK